MPGNAACARCFASKAASNAVVVWSVSCADQMPCAGFGCLDPCVLKRMSMAFPCFRHACVC